MSDGLCHEKLDNLLRGQLTWNVRLGPLGMLLGQGRQYLVAFSEYAQAVRLFALSGFEQVTLSNAPFLASPGFSLKR